MAQVEFIDVEVKPSQNYQTVGFTTRLVFNPPVSLEEAKFEADLAYAELEEVALKRVSELGKSRSGIEIPAHQMGVVAPTASSDAWVTAYKPNAAGTFKFLPTTVMSKQDFITAAESQLAGLGLNPEEVVVFDDRGGDRGIESGEKYYCAGKVKARRDSRLESIMDGKSIVGNVDFNHDGTLKVSLSRDGKTAVQAMKIAGQLSSLGATPVSEATPFAPVPF
jgi:hypothetical protein